VPSSSAATRPVSKRRWPNWASRHRVGHYRRLADRAQVEAVGEQLASGHADAVLLIDATGFFIPKPFLEYDGAFHDSYLEPDRAVFFLTQTVARGIVESGSDGATVKIGSVWVRQAIAAALSSRPPPIFTQATSGGKMSTPTGDDGFLRAVELNIRAELALAETGQSEEEAVDVPIDKWLVDPEEEQHYEVGLHSLLGAVEALEDSPGDTPSPTEERRAP
jgi:hypothetical protein